MCARQAIFTCFPRSSNAPPSRRLHMPALLKASMKTAVEAASSCEGKKKKKNNPRRTPGTQGEGQIQLGLPGRGVSLGFSSSQLPREREEFRLGPTCPGGGIQAA